MENASKALLMTAGVLIGILILSLAVYLFVTFGAESRRIQDKIDSNQLVQYNTQYTIYAGREDITIYEIISVANLAKENNEYYQTYGDYKTAYKVTVDAQSLGDNLEEATSKKKQELLELNNGVNSEGKLQNVFTCSKIEYHKNGRVKSINFKTTI